MTTSGKALDLWFIRHGQTAWNREGRIQGQSESTLNDVGRLEARSLRERLADVGFDKIYSSDLKRTTQTAALVFPDRSITLDSRLREIAGGYLEGKTVAEMSPENQQMIRQIDSRYLDVRPPGGESYLDVISRLRGWIEDLPRSGRIACVTHEAVIYSMLVYVLGVTEGRDVGPQIQLLNTSITQIMFAGVVPMVVRINDASHRAGVDSLVVVG